MTRFANFAALANHFADQADAFSRDENQSHGYATSFIEQNDLAKLSIVDAPEALDMPDPQMARYAVEMVMTTLFDVFRDTRMESYAADLAWGFVNSFHMVAKRIENREDDAAKDLGELARCFDPSEIYATELEDKQLLAQTLFDARQAMGSRVSSGFTASQIEAKDFLAMRSRSRREEYAPTGPVVAFSGGSKGWEDHELIWDRLDNIKARVPEMILVTTAQTKGCDQIAAAWASSRGVKLVMFRLQGSATDRTAGFKRNDKIVDLRPVEAIVCEGSGLQANLAQKLRQAGTPIHIIRMAQQRTTAAA